MAVTPNEQYDMNRPSLKEVWDVLTSAVTGVCQYVRPTKTPPSSGPSLEG